MKKSIENIAIEKQNEINEIIEYIKESNDHNCVEMVILFGSYARGEAVEDTYKDEKGTTYEYKSDFDILMLMKDEKKAKNSTIKNLIRRKLKRNENIKTPLSIIFHGIEYVNEQLKNRSYFFLDIYNEGILLFDTERYILEEPVAEKDLPKDVRLSKASFYYEKWLKSADGFLLGFENYYKLKEYKLAVFNLHQTAEHLYMGILLVHTDYKPKTHNLLELNQEVIEHDSRFEEAFPCNTAEEERLFKKLKDAYIDSRYNDDFVINEGELIYMAGRVRILQKLAERICNEYIQRYSENAGELSKELRLKIERLANGIDDFYDIRENARKEEKKLIAEAENRGLEKGKVLGEKSGIEKGKKEEKISIARKLLLEGVAVEDVARVTELSVAEVMRIK